MSDILTFVLLSSLAFAARRKKIIDINDLDGLPTDLLTHEPTRRPFPPFSHTKVPMMMTDDCHTVEEIQSVFRRDNRLKIHQDSLSGDENADEPPSELFIPDEDEWEQGKLAASGYLRDREYQVAYEDEEDDECQDDQGVDDEVGKEETNTGEKEKGKEFENEWEEEVEKEDDNKFDDEETDKDYDGRKIRTPLYRMAHETRHEVESLRLSVPRVRHRMPSIEFHESINYDIFTLSQQTEEAILSCSRKSPRTGLLSEFGGAPPSEFGYGPSTEETRSFSFRGDENFLPTSEEALPVEREGRLIAGSSMGSFVQRGRSSLKSLSLSGRDSMFLEGGEISSLVDRENSAFGGGESCFLEERGYLGVEGGDDAYGPSSDGGGDSYYDDGGGGSCYDDGSV